MGKNWGVFTDGFKSSLNPAEEPPKKILWGVAPTGDIHLGYALYFYLLRRLQQLGTQPLILIANYHAYLDSCKTAWSLLDSRTLAYRAVFESAGLSDIVETRDFYLKRDYIEALFELSARLNVQESLKAGYTTLRSAKVDAKVADLMYITTQILDVKFLDADCVLCGIDESPIYRFGLPILKHNYGIVVGHVYIPMCPGIEKSEMHASDSQSNKILMSDNEIIVREKVSNHFLHFCNHGVVPLALYCRDTLFPLTGHEQLSEQMAITSNSRSGHTMVEIISTGISQVLSELFI